MPRDSSGVFTLVGNPQSSGTTITSAWANTLMDDLETGVTDSLDRNGRGGMNVALKFVDGIEAAPGIAWVDEPGTGFWRSGAGDVRFSILGTEMLRYNGGDLSIWKDAAWTPLLYSGGAGSVPETATDEDMLYWNDGNSAWEAQAIPAQVPATANEDETLRRSASAWVATDAIKIDSTDEVGIGMTPQSGMALSVTGSYVGKNDGTIGVNMYEAIGVAFITAGAAATPTSATKNLFLNGAAASLVAATGTVNLDATAGAVELQVGAATRLAIKAGGQVRVGAPGGTTDTLRVNGVAGDDNTLNVVTSGGLFPLQVDDATGQLYSPTARNDVVNDLEMNIDSVTGQIGRVTSSRRYKKDIEPIAYGLAEVIRLKPVSYTMRLNNQKKVGFVAEDIDKLGLKELVNYMDDKPEALKYGEFTAVLAKAVQELNSKVEALSARLTH